MSRFSRSLPALLISIHAALLTYGAWIHSSTIDEPGHLASGLLNWQSGNYEPYRVNPPLYRQVAVLPVLLLSPRPLNDSFALTVDPWHRSESHAGSSFARMNQDRYRVLMFASRLAGIGWSCLGAYLIFLWARTLYGRPAGLLCLSLWCFEPTVLGHAQLLTPDVPASVTCLLAMWYFRGYLLRPSWGNAYLVGLTLGVALLMKFTSLILLPVCLVLLVWAEPIVRPTRLRRTLVRFGHATLAFSTALLLVNLDYEFTKFGRPLGSLEFVSDWFAGERPAADKRTTGNRFRGTVLESVRLPLPADYLHGMDVQRRDFETGAKSVSSFLNGEWKAGGWWYYYLYAFAVKVPLGFQLLLALGLLGALRRPRREELVLYLPGIAIFVMVSSQTGFNHHFRYVLPSFPFLIVGAGRLFAAWETISRARRVLVSVALAWGVSASLWFAPHHLSYFNESVGGPKNGYQHLVDSNIDWGQDLILLKQWLDAHPEAAEMRFALFFYPDLETWGLKEAWPPVDPSIPGEFFERGPKPGWYAVSVNAIQGRYLLRSYPRLAFRYFQELTPVGRIGYSIYLYHIPEEARGKNEVRSPP